MKLLATAIALLVLGLACAHHTPEHRFRAPKFTPRKTHVYDVTINATSGVPGLHPQVAKAVLKMDLKIFSTSDNDFVMQLENVRRSGSLHGVGSNHEQVELKHDSELEERLKKPIKGLYAEDGKIISYTLDSSETLESEKIKKSILRALEFYIDEKVALDSSRWPLTYNLTRFTPEGNYTSHYIVTSSPNVAFPMDQNVFNISRTDNYETMLYPAYHYHHNFEQQGCPKYQTPMQKSYVQHHNLRTEKGELLIESIHTKETHMAYVYDQTMEVVIRSNITLKRRTSEVLKEPTGQQTYNNLNELVTEDYERAIQKECKLPESREAITIVTELLKKITETVIENEMESEKSKIIGEELIHLQKILSVLKVEELKTVLNNLVNFEDMPKASQEEKVKRQILLDTLPLIGSPESVTFIVELIKDSMNQRNKVISLWEAKTILESLPENIWEPTGKTISELIQLLDVLPSRETPGWAMYHSAAHMTVSRVIQDLCSVEKNGEAEEESAPQNIQRILREKSSEYRTQKCPKTIVKKYIQDIAEKLKSTDDKILRIHYIQFLARTGLRQVLPILTPYVHGKIPNLTPRYIDFVRTVTMHALHNVVPSYPKEVRDMLIPVFFNHTESPKVRIAAFTVLVACRPTLGDLQLVAEQSWNEPSKEVASFVSSTLTTFGNSSLPCHQPLVNRIQKVLPMLKKFEDGTDHAKNLMHTVYDDIRSFGLEHHMEYVPSNESFFPTTLYGSLGFNMVDMKQYLYQYAINTQGLTSRNVWDRLFHKILNREPATDIPKETESEIFREIEMAVRDPEFWRFTVYEKLFYQTSYLYLDGEEDLKTSVLDILKEQLTHYFTRDSQGNWEGHLVKVFIPSSYHAKAEAHILPYPVRFEMRNPLLLSLKLNLENVRSRSEVAYAVHVTPSLYYSTIYTNEILNLGDCKSVGVYHDKRVALTYPFKAEFNFGKDMEFYVAYSFPELPKKIASLSSEAGTFAGVKGYSPLPSKQEKMTFETIPAQFVNRTRHVLIGLPPLETQVKSEDIDFQYYEVPRTPTEAVHLIIRQGLNAGWRRKSIELRRTTDDYLWTPESKVKLFFNFTREQVTARKPVSEREWSKNLNFEERLNQKDTTSYASEGQTIYNRLVKSLTHLRDELTIEMHQVHSNSDVPTNRAGLLLRYLHTPEGFLHMLHVEGNADIPNLFRRGVNVSADYALAFINRPNEFKYGDNTYGKQRGLAIGAISTSTQGPFKQPLMITKALFGYKPLDKHMNHEMDRPVPQEYFLPEKHEECVHDVREGKALSVDCIKAIEEGSIYNHLQVHAIWDNELPWYVRRVAHKADGLFKYVYYPKMNVFPREHTKGIYVNAYYIDKLTDTPVVDINITKPDELLQVRRISAEWFRPMSSIENVLETGMKMFTNNSYPATCALMNSYVRTYDLKTYPLPNDVPACTYVVSSHCTEHKKFAVLAKITSQNSGAQEIYIYVGKDKIVLIPGSRSEFRIKYNEREIKVRPLQPVVLNEEERIHAFVQTVADGSYFVELHAEKAGLKVVYDGKNVKVQVLPKYKGELCGLCSEFNGETTREYVGPDSCLYSHSDDFFKSSIVGTCGDKTPVHPFMCPEGSRKHRQETDDKDEEDDDEEERSQKRILKRNVVLPRGDQLCFSTKPVPVCEDNETPAMTKMESISFHCLPKLDINARKLYTESQRRILGELETKRVDMVKSIEVAKKC